MSKGLGDRHIFVEHVLALSASATEKPAQLLVREVCECSTWATSGVERNGAEEALFFELLNQASIKLRSEVCYSNEPPADKLAASVANKCLHFGMAGPVIRAFNENEARFVFLGGTPKLALGWRQALGIFKAVVIAEEADIHAAAVHFIEVDVVGAAVGGGEILKKENVEVTLH